ncbi:zinc finger protein 271-like [Sitodiplosis mosellana]|uniref:zinc finger protein 271-like n=1 Tax=Sitodiplosis mosellana TaxID=263140 RepID=UPI0024445070|nr:zinc finger protein 271-like [Sitodiplosis mosellana]
MEVICYLCNEQTNDWRVLNLNFTELKSQHSNTPIVDLLKRFLDDFESQRDIENETNCVCPKCLDRINDYDRMCVLCEEKEKELKELLLTTEKWHMSRELVLQSSDLQSSDAEHGLLSKEIEVDLEIKEEPIAESDPKLDSVADPISIENASVLMIQVEEDGSEYTYEIMVEDNDDAEIELKETEMEHDCKIKEEPNSEPEEPNSESDDESELGSNENESQAAETIIKQTLTKQKKTDEPSSKRQIVELDREIPQTNRKRFWPGSDEIPKNLNHEQFKRYCTQCKIYFRRSKYYKIHMEKIHHPKCEFCDIIFKTSDELTVHMQWHDTMIGVLCQICHFQLANEDKHRKHLELHNEKLKNQCVLCDKNFVNRKYLVLHVKQHKALCDLCDKRFMTHERMTIHRQTHLDGNRFKCSHCPKTFTTSDHLRAHEKIHSSASPFACLFCGMRFKNKFLHQVHEKRHTENMTEKCTLCLAIFEHKFHLEQHMEEWHGDEHKAHKVLKKTKHKFTHRNVYLGLKLVYHIKLVKNIKKIIMEVICYVCNEQTDDWRRNFTELKSQHSNTPIVDFLKRFLDDFVSQRNIESESNCICAKCLDRIDDYDWVWISCTEKEKVLKELLWTTEKSHMSRKTELIQALEHLPSSDGEHGLPPKEIKMEAECEIKEEPIVESDPKLDAVADPISIENISVLVVQVEEAGSEYTYEIMVEDNDDAEVELEETEMEHDCEIKEEPNSESEEPYSESEHEPEWDSNENGSTVSETIIQPKPAFHLHHSSSKKQIAELDTNNEKNPVDKLVAFQFRRHAKLPGTELRTKRLSMRRDVDSKTLTEKQLQRYCAPCRIYFRVTKDYKRHLFRHQRTCNLCNVTFSNLEKYSVHMQWHNSPAALMCRICNFKLPNENEHRKHLKLHEGKSNRQCVICDIDKEFTSVSGLRHHVKNHGEADVLCDLCAKKFHSTDALRKHRQIHLNENPYKCSHCPKSFKTYGYLWVHEKIHTSTERPFTCSVCDMRFKRKDHWKAHEKRHTENTKTVKCTLCPAAYEHKFHLKQHMERRHGAEQPQGTKKLKSPKMGERGTENIE